MKTDVDTCLREIADFYIKNRRGMNEPELESILQKHCVDAKEIRGFTAFLGTKPGQTRFKTILMGEANLQKTGLDARTEKQIEDMKAMRGIRIRPSYLKEPFIKVDEKVRFIGSSKSRYGNWPEGKWLEYGVTGTVTEYHQESPAVRVGGEYFEALPSYAVVRWDLGGEASTVINPDDEGKRWERIPAKASLKETGEMSTLRDAAQAGKYRLEIGKAASLAAKQVRVSPHGITRVQLLDILGKVPDRNDTGLINYWVDVGDKRVYIEGWCNKCIASWGYPKRDEEGAYETFFEVGERLTPEIIERKATDNPFNEKMKLLEGGWVGTPNAKNLYGITYGIYEKPSSNPNIPKTRVTSLGIDLELPVARAVEALVEENPWSSGFHGALNQRWTIVFKGKISDRAVNAAKVAGLEVSYREAPKGSGQILTDVSLPGVSVSEIEKATEVFNKFAELYEGSILGKYSYKEQPQAEKARSYAEGLGYRASLQHRGDVWELTVEKTQGGSTSYLKEATAVAETECQIISPRYFDVLAWLGIPVPDYSFAIEAEVKERKIDEVLQKLKDGVASIHESAIFREFLLTMSKFHQYSIGNQILIMLQRPEATRVAGFNTWKDLGRYVKAGERGIAILAPCLPPKGLRCPICGQGFTERELRTHLSEVHRREDISALVREAREEAVVVPTPTYFKVVYVFDVAQTEGKALPEIVVPVLTGAYNDELFSRLMKLALKYDLTIQSEPRPGQDPQIKGMLLAKTIWIRPEEPEAQRLKTLAHEEAHYFTENVYFIPHAEAEVIAESVAFVVGAHFGFDSGVRSFPYVALWAKEKKVLEQNLASIRKISGRMIEEVGGVM